MATYSSNPAPHEELTQTYSNLTRAVVVGMGWYGGSPLLAIGAFRPLPRLIGTRLRFSTPRYP